MRPRHLFAQILLPFLVLNILAIILVAWYSFSRQRTLFLDQASNSLLATARLLANQLAQENIPGEDLQDQVRRWGVATGMHITLIKPDGWVQADSLRPPHTMENYAGRPEIREAARGSKGLSTRYSQAAKQRMIYAALPVKPHGETTLFVRTAISASAIDAAVDQLIQRVVLGTGLLTAIVILLSILFVRRITRPLDRMTHQALSMAEGDFSKRVEPPESDELARLAGAMNEMARRLDHNISSLHQQQNQQKAMFSSMMEGVLALNANEEIIDLNKAAVRILGLDRTTIIGRHVREVIRDPNLLRLMDQLAATDQTIEQPLELHHSQELHVRAYATRLLGQGGEHMGALFVFFDVTELRKLEGIRRDFVANVSHELKTPATSIIGFVETLLDGAINDQEHARKFLTIIDRQARRLTAIIEDLLSLSRIEQEYEPSHIERRKVRISSLVQGVITECCPQASARDISIEQQIPEQFTANINSALIEQALLNLIVNAIKYARESTTVTVKAFADSTHLHIEVHDQSDGIAAEHLPRLFERFYRIDRARSRDAGGTGLGLAIVKHIAQAHGGQATVNSTLGQGSVFALHLPLHETPNEHVNQDAISNAALISD